MNVVYPPRKRKELPFCLGWAWRLVGAAEITHPNRIKHRRRAA